MSIGDFIKEKQIAVVGVSAKKKKFGNQIYEKLVTSGYTAYAVNPNANIDSEIKFYNSLKEVPNAVSVIFVTSPNVTNKILKEEIPPNIKFIWIQQGAGNGETESILRTLDAEFVYNKCLFMYLEPVNGLHKFHRTIDKLFGNYVS